MKNLIVLFIALFFMSCENLAIDPATETTGEKSNIEAEFYYNGLAYDGCDTHIQLSNGADKPATVLKVDAKAKVLLDKFVTDEEKKLAKGDYLKSFKVVISYKTTGKKDELVCGWGMKSMVDTIELTAIKRK